MTDGQLTCLVQYQPQATKYTKQQCGHQQTAKSTKSRFFVVFTDIWLIIPSNGGSKVCWSANWPLPVIKHTQQCSEVYYKCMSYYKLRVSNTENINMWQQLWTASVSLDYRPCSDSSSMLHHFTNCIIIIVVYTVPAAGILNIRLPAPAVSNGKHPNPDLNPSLAPNRNCTPYSNPLTMME